MWNIARRVYRGGPLDPLILRWTATILLIIYSLHCLGSIVNSLAQVSLPPARIRSNCAPRKTVVVLQIDDVQLPSTDANLIAFHNDQWCKHQGYAYEFVNVRNNDPFARIQLCLERLHANRHAYVLCIDGNVCFNNGVQNLEAVPRVPVVDKSVCFAAVADAQDFKAVSTKRQFVSFGWPDEGFLLMRNDAHAVQFCNEVLKSRAIAGKKQRVSYWAAVRRAIRIHRSICGVLNVQEAGTVRRNSLIIRIPYYAPSSVKAFRQSRHMLHLEDSDSTALTPRTIIEPRIPQPPRRG